MVQTAASAPMMIVGDIWVKNEMMSRVVLWIMLKQRCLTTMKINLQRYYSTKRGFAKLKPAAPGNLGYHRWCRWPWRIDQENKQQHRKQRRGFLMEVVLDWFCCCGGGGGG